ncbi:BCCT family transporter [Pseudomonas oryzae]|uniref:BCCT family transporter n=1 Tax=Pseudomonas oryzae TaxID=1392877 RepID=UPI0022B2584D|nr:BCCT family transporter [Pseudomonas oryzae]
MPRAYGADSGALVVDNLAAGGDPNTHRAQRVLWLGMIAIVTISLFVVGGNKALQGIQAGAVAMGLPFMALMLLMMIGFLKALFQEARD